MQRVGYATICVEKEDKRLCKPIFLGMGKISLEGQPGLPLERQTEWLGTGVRGEFSPDTLLNLLSSEPHEDLIQN